MLSSLEQLLDIPDFNKVNWSIETQNQDTPEPATNALSHN